LTFNHHNTYSSINKCELQLSNHPGYGQCLKCQIFQPMTSLDNITIEKNCSPLPALNCIDLYFNNTKSYQNFSLQYSSLINKLFDGSNATIVLHTNTLNIHIEYDALDQFAFATFRSFDHIKNRHYARLSFELKNRDDRLTLLLSPDIENMTLDLLQINIYCGSKGLYQYHYFPSYQRLVENSLTCEIPPVVSATTVQSISSTKNQSSTSEMPRYKFILMFSLIGGGSLLPCLLLACCLYILCKLNKQQNVINNERRSSITSSLNDSIASDTSLS
jgi:hypothetical protein